MDLNVCAAVKRGNATNMAIIELSCPTGFEFIDDQLDDLVDNKSCSRWEPADKKTKVKIYLQSLYIHDICFTVSAFRSMRVSRYAKVYSKVYDYYNLQRETLESYTFIDDAPACEPCPFGRDSCNQTRPGCT